MKRGYPVKKKLAFRENIQKILPLMYDDFISYKEKVVNHPRTKSELHRMRITGKPMRYAMEYSETAFGDEFKKCLTEVKNIIELIGEIHDADVLIPELGVHLSEIRSYNRTLANRREHLSTKGIRKLISELKEKRTAMFEKFCAEIIKWLNEDFRSRLIAAMNAPTYNLTLVKPQSLRK
jgi:CHAD domain-containing protein